MRLVSLCPSITKLIFDLGRGEDLAGVTKYCVHPAEGVAGIEKLGGTKDPDVARIIALAPDLVLLNREENRREDWAALSEAGVPCCITLPVTLDETESAVAEIGAAVAREAEAAALVARIRAARRRARAARDGRGPARWAYLIWRKPWMTVNRATYIHHLLAEAGGANVFADLDPEYPAIEADALAAADPDAVLLSSEPFPFKDKHIRELSGLTGLPTERFRIVDGELLSWHGAFTAEGLDYAADLLADFSRG